MGDTACDSPSTCLASDERNRRVLRGLTSRSNAVAHCPIHQSLAAPRPPCCATKSSNARTQYRAHARLAYAKQLVSIISNLRFGPEAGIGKIKDDAPVVDLWLSAMRTMASDLQCMQSTAAYRVRTPTAVHCADARQPETVLSPRSMDAVITSPPYSNEKDYSRTTRRESVLLDFLHDRPALRAQKAAVSALQYPQRKRITMTIGWPTIRASRPSRMLLRPGARPWVRHPSLKSSTPA